MRPDSGWDLLVKYLRQVEAGETLIIVRFAQPIAELRPIASNK
ncbi:type II toxin-antitoxin system Phd/YefM family antitoxin [Pantanalinema sp. GBBB05]